MKEAAGEANMTVITIVLIAIVLGVGTLIVTNVMGNTKKSGCCTSNGGVWYSGHCYSAEKCGENNTGKMTCSETADDSIASCD